MVRKAFSYIRVKRGLLHLQNGIYIKVKILNIYESPLSHLEDYFEDIQSPLLPADCFSSPLALVCPAVHLTLRAFPAVCSKWLWE